MQDLREREIWQKLAVSVSLDNYRLRGYNNRCNLQLIRTFQGKKTTLRRIVREFLHNDSGVKI